MFRVVIPARYASTRLPGKPLMPLAGKTMLEWVWSRARASQAGEVLVATDDARIATVARGFGAAVELTAVGHPSGTARVAEVAARRAWAAESIVVNVQGDEPLLPPALIDQVASLLASHPDADLATLATPLRDRQQFLDPGTVKVVSDVRSFALYFSRAPIPWPRDASPGAPPPEVARRHLGLYAYRVAALLRLAAPANAAARDLEDLEKLEQLRALALGLRIVVADATMPPGPDVNSPEDVPAAEALLRRH
jgi:3-deoxy-manno-octulosonate cytidylyltransferase (CMP-KDO synthetase)